ncbi:hypothetical protein [Leuconostoc citreum]|uniref:hypothetical protein n=1 Tax=Leuconostoc citreum TaxID=33964 RepID=UPI0032DE3014
MIDDLFDPRLETKPTEQVLYVMRCENKPVTLVYRGGQMITTLLHSDISFDADNDVVVLNTRSIVRMYLANILKGYNFLFFSSILVFCLSVTLSLGTFGVLAWLAGLGFWSMLVIIMAFFLVGDIQNLLNLRNLLLSKNDDELMENFDYDKNNLVWLSFMGEAKQLVYEKIGIIERKTGKSSDELGYNFFSSATYLERLANNECYVDSADEPDFLEYSQLTKQAIECEIDDLTKYDEFKSIAEHLERKYLSKI